MTTARRRVSVTVTSFVAMCYCAAGGDGEADLTRSAVGWKRAEPYFRVGGKQAFVLGRNPTGWRTGQFRPLLKWAEESGERIVRIHITSGMSPKSGAGVVDEEWASKWELVFDQAAERSLYILPVFAAWAQWNDGSDGRRWHYWDRNPYNARLGGPARTPSELFAQTPCQQLWLKWLGQMVRRWRNRPNIVVWEVFSELDLVTGSTEGAALQFTQQAAKVVRGRIRLDDRSPRPSPASGNGPVCSPTMRSTWSRSTPMQAARGTTDSSIGRSSRRRAQD